MPLFGVENKIDADLIFKQMMKQREKERRKPPEESAKQETPG
jgi:hypothetical protein